VGAIGGGRRRLDLAAIALPTLLAAGLCAYQLGTRSLWLDEAASFSIASQHGGALGPALARDGGNMLAYYGLLHVLTGAFGAGAVLLRIPSAVAACVTAGLTAAICLQLWDRRIAVSAGMLTAVSLTLVYWGQDARSYTLMMALIAGSFLTLLWLLDGTGPGWARWLTYVALTVAALYAGLEAALIVPAQMVVLLWRRDRLWPVLSAILTAALACLPLAILAAERGSGQLFWVPAPSLRTAKQILQALTSSGLQPGYYTATGDALLILTLGVLLTGSVLVLARVRSRAPGSHPLVLVLAWLTVPVLLALLISLAGHSIFQARYALVSLPAVGILIAWTLRAAPVPTGTGVAVLAVLLTLRALALAPSYGASTEQWRAATAFVSAQARSGDCVAFYPLDTRMPFEYYGGASGRLPDPVLPTLPWGRVRPYVEEYRTLSRGQLAVLPARCARVWLVWSHEGQAGGPPVSAANFRRLLSLRRGLALRFPRTALHVFGHASPIHVELFKGAAWPGPDIVEQPLLTRTPARAVRGAA